MINRDAEAVGLIFDGNIQSLGGDFGFDPEQNRAVAVAVGAVCEAYPQPRSMVVAGSGAEAAIALSPQDTQHCRDSAPARRQDGASEQHQGVRLGRTGEQIGKDSKPIGETRRQRIRTAGGKTGVLHPIRRIGALSRGNLAGPRQSESMVNSNLVYAPAHEQTHNMMQTDPTLAKVAAQFTKFDIQPSRGAYMIVDRRTSNPIARLRPIPDTDRFELFYWSNVKGRWTTFGNMGRMKLMLKSAHSGTC